MNYSNLSVIHPDAQIGKNVIIGPFTTIAADVVIEDGTWIAPHVSIMDGARIGKNCKIFQGAIVGSTPQDLKYKGEKSSVVKPDMGPKAAASAARSADRLPD